MVHAMQLPGGKIVDVRRSAWSVPRGGSVVLVDVADVDVSTGAVVEDALIACKVVVAV